MRPVAVCAAFVVAACSNLPSAAPTNFPPQPANPVNVNGSWITSWASLNGSGQSCVASATLNLVQTVTGGVPSGTFTGTYNNLVVGCGALSGNSAPAWTPSDTVVSGQQVYDANNNIEQAGPARWAPKTAYSVGQIVMDPNNLLEQVTVAGTSSAKGPKTWSKTVAGTTTDSTITWTNIGADATGASAPAWNATVGGTTTDGSVVWTNMGPKTATAGYGTANGTVSGYNITMNLVDPVGGAATFVHSGVVNNANPLVGPWAAKTTYTKGSQIVDKNNNIEQATDSGSSGSATPNFTTTVGGTTVDSTVTWLNLGSTFQLIGTTVWSNASYRAMGIVTPCGNGIANALGCKPLSVAADTTPIAVMQSNWVATSH